MLRSLLVCAALAVAGCSNVNGEPSGFDTAVSLVGGGSEATTARFQALRGAPRPIMQVGLVDAGTGGNMLLEARNGPYEHYLSPNASSMIFNDGFLHQTIGFGEPLMATEVGQVKRLILGGRSGSADRIHTYVGGDDREEFRTYRCTIVNTGTQPLSLPNRTAQTVVMSESCRNADQAFANIYWVEQGRGQIVQSRQWAGPTLGAVSTRRAGLSQ